MKVVLLFGGRGAEHDVSLSSAAFVLPRLKTAGHTVFPVGVCRDGSILHYTGDADALSHDWQKDARALLLTLSRGKLLLAEREGECFIPDIVFSVLHGTDGEDGAWQGLFTLTRTPFVGSNILSSALCMNKRLAKELAAAHGLPVVPYLFTHEYSEAFAARVSHTLRYPLFVKPTSGGSSVGTSRVADPAELKAALSLALSHDGEALVEEEIAGSELSVGVLSRGNTLLLSPPGEITTPRGFYDYAAKYEKNEAQIQIPASLPLWETALVKQMAATLFRLFDCRDLARIDFLRRADGRIFFNEINTLPGFTAHSLFPALFAPLCVDPLIFLLEGRA